MPAFTYSLNTLVTNDPELGEFVIVHKPDHQKALVHALDLRGEFLPGKAEGYALLDYPPCWHLAEFRANRLIRYLPLTRTNLRLAFGQERGDRWSEHVRLRRRAAR
jgi:hypothetical protein